METKYQTSFIPKKPVTTSGQSHSGSTSLLLIVSIIIFLSSIGLAGYVFLEKQFLTNKIITDQASIETNKGGLLSDSVTIESLIALNSRINIANGLLGKHVAISPVFDFLQKATLEHVQFKNFNFTSAGKDTSGQNKVSIQMSGIADDWETVASQSDEFGKPDWKKIISEPKITSFSLNTDNSRISFQFAAFVSPDYLFYANNITTN